MGKATMNSDIRCWFRACVVVLVWSVTQACVLEQDEKHLDPLSVLTKEVDPAAIRQCNRLVQALLELEEAQTVGGTELCRAVINYAGHELVFRCMSECQRMAIDQALGVFGVRGLEAIADALNARERYGLEVALFLDYLVWRYQTAMREGKTTVGIVYVVEEAMKSTYDNSSAKRLAQRVKEMAIK